ncbi:MAG: hypothetical protein HYV93_11465 [Candidatus Rokubacteria bacterium]|nr:hypothetical protein [Candidatus Rokubacteria bacterium]
MTIIEALADPAVFGGLPAFRDLTTWRRWIVFLKAVYGLPMDLEEEGIFRHHTGRSRYAPPPGGYPEGVVVVGRQSGKSRVAALIADFEAVVATAQHDGTEIYALLIGQDHLGAIRTLLRYARAPFEMLPTLAKAVVAQTADTLRLDNGVVLAAYPCRPAAIRGVRGCVGTVDELAHFITSEGRATDVEMLRALRPCLATTGGRLIVLSSPYGQSGALWDLYHQHYGRDDSLVLVWQASAPEMNPLIPANYLERMQDDPEAYRSEVLGEFRAGLAALFDPDVFDGLVPDGIRERPPAPGTLYVAGCDPSGGRRDRFGLSIGHHDGQRAVLDLARAWAPPFNPSRVIAECSDILATYGCGAVFGDRYAGEFVAEQFRAHGIEYIASRDKSVVYLDLLALVNAGGAVLLDHPGLLRELRGLERRRGTSGRDRIDHRPGAHDDLAVAAAVALTTASSAAGAAPADMALTAGEYAQIRRALPGLDLPSWSARQEYEVGNVVDDDAADGPYVNQWHRWV